MIKNLKKVIQYMIPLVQKKKPILFFAYFLFFITTLVRNIISFFSLKLIIDQLIFIYNGENIKNNIIKVIIFIICIILINFITNIITGIAERIRGNCDEWFNEFFQVKVNEVAMCIPYADTENPNILEQMKKAKEGIGYYSGNVCGILNNFFDAITNLFLLICVIIVICFYSPIILLIEFFSLFFITLFNKKLQKIEIKSFQNLAKINRVYDYFFFALSDFRNGKDIRLYNCSNLFLNYSRKILEQQKNIWRSKAKENQKQQIGINIVSSVERFGIYTYLGIQAIKGYLTIGNFTMCIAICTSINTSCISLIKNIQEILKRINYIIEYLNFLELSFSYSKGECSVNTSSSHDIEFRNVSFKYPYSKNFVLQNISLKIPSGQHLAIVGLNGAGKTTFIKLLCRMYDVSEGEILVDGININKYSEEEYYKLFSIVFQDFRLLQFSLRENISFSTETPDEEIDCVLKKSGLFEDVQKMPHKADTIMWKSFDKNGLELSGGQQQKLALSRALYKNAPIVILDEPTAALDPMAESEIYNQFNTNLIGGKTALYISHRLSSCKFCDKIIVLNEGEIQESGTHQELMKNTKGLYYKMFTAQAELYKEEIK